jgi:hypothetical protein
VPVAEVVAGPVALLVDTVLLLVVDGPPRIAVPEILCGFADALGKKVAGVIVLVYDSANESVTAPGVGKTENAFPAELYRLSFPGMPVGRVRGL